MTDKQERIKKLKGEHETQKEEVEDLTEIIDKIEEVKDKISNANVRGQIEIFIQHLERELENQEEYLYQIDSDIEKVRGIED